MGLRDRLWSHTLNAFDVLLLTFDHSVVWICGSPAYHAAVDFRKFEIRYFLRDVPGEIKMCFLREALPQNLFSLFRYSDFANSNNRLSKVRFAHLCSNRISLWDILTFITLPFLIGVLP